MTRAAAMTSKKADTTRSGYITLLLFLFSLASVHRQAAAQHARDVQKSVCTVFSMASSPCHCDVSKNHLLPEVTCRLQVGSTVPASLTTPLSVSTLDLSHSHPDRVEEVLQAGWAGRAQTMNLRHCGLTSVPEAWLANPNLRDLDLSHNNLSDVPTASHSRLKQLDLSHNRLTVFRINHLLRRVNLAHNQLGSLILTAAYPAALSQADLSYNQLRQVPLNLWQGLRHLDVSHNLLSRFPFLNGSSALRDLDVSYNNLTQLPESFLSFTPHLRTLFLAGNPLKLSHNWSHDAQLKLGGLRKLNLSDAGLLHVPRALLAATPRLLHLDLSHNRLSRLSDGDFSHPGIAASLLTLRLSNNSLRHLQPATFLHLQRLRHLDLSHNALLGEGLGGHVTLPEHVAELDLIDCSLRDVDVCQFSYLHKLRQLYLQDNPLLCTCQLTLLYRVFGKGTGSPRDNGSLQTQRPWTCVSSRTGSPVSVVKQPLDSGTVRSPFTVPDPQTTRKEMRTAAKIQHSNDMTTTLPDSKPPAMDVPELEASKEAPEVQAKDEVNTAPGNETESDVKATLKAEWMGHALIAMWDVTMEEETSLRARIQGFRTVCQHFGQNKAEGSVVHTSPVLPAAMRSYALTDVDHVEYTVCLDVLLLPNSNSTITMQAPWRICQDVPQDGPIILVGILAGVVFLFPCIVFLIYITVRDRFIQKKLKEDACNQHSLSLYLHEELDDEERGKKCHFPSLDEDMTTVKQAACHCPCCLARSVATVSVTTQTDIRDMLPPDAPNNQLTASKASPGLGPTSLESTSVTDVMPATFLKPGTSVPFGTSLPSGTSLSSGTSLPSDMPLPLATSQSPVSPDQPSSLDHADLPPPPPRTFTTVDAAADSCSSKGERDSANDDGSDSCEKKDLAGTLNSLDWQLAQLRAISE